MQQKRSKRTGMRQKGKLRQKKAAVDKRAMTNEKGGEKAMDGKGKQRKAKKAEGRLRKR